MSKKRKAIQAGIVFAVSLLLILTTLFAGENVTLRNNGDYNRVARLCSLAENAAGEFKIVLAEGGTWSNIVTILFSPGDVSTYPSCQLLFVRLSVLANYLTNVVFSLPADNYNMNCLGVMLSIFYALALTFFVLQVPVKNKYLRWGITGISLIILCDIGYVSYFNSLYAEGLQHIFLIALAGFFLLLAKRSFTFCETLLFSVVLIFYGQSKFFNIPPAILIGIAFFVLSLRHKPEKPAVFINLGAVLFSAAVLVLTMSAMPGWIQNETNYNAVFYGVVKDAEDARAKEYLERDLQLDPELYVLKNTHHYVSNFETIKETYDITGAETVSKIKLLTFYVKHPIETVKKFPVIARHSGVLRNIFFMEHDYMQSALRLRLWSHVRENAGFDTLLLNGIIIILLLIHLFVCLKKTAMPKYITVLLPVLLFCAFAYAFIVPYISNGEADLAKHMYLFCELIDLSVIALLCFAANGKAKQKTLFITLLAVVGVGALLPERSCKTLSLGGYEWYVIAENDTYQTLIAKDVVATKSYHSLPDNDYAASEIHTWLTGEFLQTFSDYEKSLLYTKDETIIVSAGHVDDVTAGNRDFYASPYPDRVAANYDSAYSKKVSGSVFLPSAAHISAMAQKGYKIRLCDKYWLSTPYFSDDGKSRYISPDGLVYFEYVTEEMGIRPVIYIKVP